MSPPGTEAIQEGAKKKIKELQDILDELGISECHRLYLKQAKSIGVFVLCHSAQQLVQLRDHYDSGALHAALERIFTILADTDDPVKITCLQWDMEDYLKCLSQLQGLTILSGTYRSYTSATTIYIEYWSLQVCLPILRNVFWYAMMEYSYYYVSLIILYVPRIQNKRQINDNS